MMNPSWRTFLQSRKSKVQRASRAKIRLRVESLEERQLMATGITSYSFDLGTIRSSITSRGANVAPTAFAGGPYAGTVGQSLTLKGSATDPNPADTAAGLTYTWNFGDGTAQVSGKNLSSPSHVYAAAGTYTVLVTATDQNRATSSVATGTVTIARPSTSPVTASAGGTYTGREGSATSLRATATGGTGTYTYAWDLDNNGTYETMGKNVSSTFQDNGSYKVGLRVTDSAGVAALSSTTVNVTNVAPTALAGGPYTGTAGQSLTLKGSATDPSSVDTAAGLTYTWNFGDNTAQVSGKNLTSPSHVFAAAGTYTVIVTATDKDKATSSVATATVTIAPPTSSPLTASAGGTYTGQEGSATSLRATATGGTGTYTYAWDLDNNGTYETAGQNVSSTFQDNGSYKVGLRVTDSAGVAALSSTTVNVTNVAPTALAGGPYEGTAGQSLTLKGSATDPSSVDTAAGFTYTWNFGDGTAVVSGKNLTSPSHVYAAAGTYTVIVTATDKDNATSPGASATATVIIAPPDTPPLTASAGGTYTGREGSATSLGATATGGTGTYSYAWDLDNNGTYETNGKNVSSTFQDNGTYKVGLRVTDSAGVAALSSTTVNVTNVAPTALAGGPYTGTAGQSLTLKGSATDPSSVDTAAGLTYTWNFGDGTAVVSGLGMTSPSHVFAAAGTYTVIVTATDKDNTTSSAASTSITISPPVAPLTASTGGTYTGREGSATSLRATATGGTGAYTYAWDLDNNGTYETAGQNVSSTYQDNGTYTVGLRVTDSAGVAALSSTTVNVTNVAPTALAGGPYTGTAGQSLTLKGSATDPSSVDTAAGLTYTWNFGDGTAVVSGKNLTSPSHVYATAGTYTVVVTATDKDSAISSGATATVTIAPPVAPLTASAGGTYTGREGSATSLRATATGGTGTYTYAWDLDNNGTYETAGQNVSSTFQDNGSYQVRLRVTDAAGVAALASTTVTVTNVVPTASAGGPYSSTAGQTLTLKGSATDPSSTDTAAGFTYTWKFGDGTADVSGKNLTSQNHVYATAGTYTATLTVTDKDGGVSSSTTAVVTVTPSGGTTTPPTGSALFDKALVKWQSQMITYGRQAAAELHAKTNIDGLGGTYYDSTRVFYQIADYTGDSSWLTAVNDSIKIYRDSYVTPNNGSVPGYWNFADGLAENYRRTGSTASRNAVLAMATSMYGADSTPASWTDSFELSREVAYSLMANLEAESLGAPHRAKTDQLANQALGHLNQWTVSRTASFVKPFMVALTSEALIAYYDKTGDSRVLPAVRTALDWIWNNTWVAADRAFLYANAPTNDDPVGRYSAPDLNLLIAPAFGWVYHQTGNTTYRDRGDAIFAGGVDQAWLVGAKQFNQSYRWSFDYVKYRTQPVLGS
ncbi:PKD domain-containing protein [Singulisphaera sp. Ch08]|uniref:PKD domain-containing protein n=1 Tax=Singulisphaera sp. Ch08 TaxID=3120278 RepID=A0AAU7CCN8_9BACT